MGHLRWQTTAQLNGSSVRSWAGSYPLSCCVAKRFICSGSPTTSNLTQPHDDLEGMQVNNLIHIPYIFHTYSIHIHTYSIHIPYIFHTYSIHIPPKIGAVLGGKFSEPREPSDHIQHCIANLTQHSCTMAWQLEAPAAKVQSRSKTTIEDEHVNKNFTNLSWWLLQPPQTCGSRLDLGNLGSPMTWQADLGWQVPHHLT